MQVNGNNGINGVHFTGSNKKNEELKRKDPETIINSLQIYDKDGKKIFDNGEPGPILVMNPPEDWLEKGGYMEF